MSLVATGLVGASLLWTVPSAAQKARDTPIAVTLPAFGAGSSQAVFGDAVAAPYVTSKAQSVWAEIRSGQNFFLTLGTHRADSSRGLCIELPGAAQVFSPGHPYLDDVQGAPDVCFGDGQWFTGDGQSVLAMTAGVTIGKLMRLHWHDPSTDEGYHLSWGSDLDGLPGSDSDHALVTCLTDNGTRCTSWQITHATTSAGPGRARLYDETFGLVADFRLEFAITVSTP
jgi:hypothetical protein